MAKNKVSADSVNNNTAISLRRRRIPIGTTPTVRTNSTPTTATAMSSCLLMMAVVASSFVLVSMSGMIERADAFVVRGRGRGGNMNGNMNGNYKSSSSSLTFVVHPSSSKIRHYPSTTTATTRTTAYTTTTTKLYSEDDDDDDDDSDMNDDDYDDDDYDDSELIIDVEGDDDYDEDEEDDDDDDDNRLDVDPYIGLASSEFENDSSSSSALTTTTTTTIGGGSNGNAGGQLSLSTTDVDWGGALGSLRTRMEDVESGKSNDPSQALFRMMSAPSPNQIIGQFVSSANPQVVQAMSGAVTSLLGGLSNPNMGVEIQVKASGEKIGSLCFQLQMTGYMFRNAEYVLALKELMKLKGKQLTLDDYKQAFDRLDSDGSGYIESSEIQELFQEAYNSGSTSGSSTDGSDESDDEDVVPAYEITAFLEFFDTNADGKVSWEEFEKGLAASGSAAAAEAATTANSDKFADRLLASMEEAGGGNDDDVDDDVDDHDHDHDHDHDDLTETISGTIEIEMDDGKVVRVDAKEYMENLKEEAQKLKLALRREKMGTSGSGDARQQNEQQNDPMTGFLQNNANVDDVVDIAGYIASRQGDVKSLTEGIKPEIVDTMRKLVEFVLEGGSDSGRAAASKNKNNKKNQNQNNLSDQDKAEMEMEIPGSALQQLALWQLVLGYRLREEEVKGDYVKLLK